MQWKVDALQIKDKWESNINVWFPIMYSQKWNCECAASLFPKQNYNALSPNSYTHSVHYTWVRFIYFQDRFVYFAAAKYLDRSWEYINWHECRYWDGGRTISFLRIHKLDFRYSVGYDKKQKETGFINFFLMVWLQEMLPGIVEEKDGQTRGLLWHRPGSKRAWGGKWK